MGSHHDLLILTFGLLSTRFFFWSPEFGSVNIFKKKKEKMDEKKRKIQMV